jgi:hypothetical protein
MALPGEMLMDYEIAEVLEPKLAFGYDFGSTTQLKLKVAGMRTGKWTGKDKVRLLARNLAPDLKCGRCGQPATLIDGMNDELFCAKRAKNADEEELLLPVVNSPRMGVVRVRRVSRLHWVRGQTATGVRGFSDWSIR